MDQEENEFAHNTLYDRVYKLLVSSDWSDCSFLVCGKKFKAHKLILGASSPVFEAMFYGPLCSNEEITITDIEPSIFQRLLNYIYSDKLYIDTIDEAYEILYASEKYMLENLTAKCLKFIHSNLDIDNVITVLNYPDYIQSSYIVSSALRLLCQHANYLLKENKTHITLSCMQKIIKSNEINISEIDLIKNVFEWTSHYCNQSNITADIENRRDVLIKCGLLKSLRFLTLSLAEIEDIKTCEHNLLLDNEIEDLQQMVKSSGDIANSSTFDTKKSPRTALFLHWCLCHRAPIKSESPIVIDPVSDPHVHTRVKANKSTFISSITVQSRMEPVFNHSNMNVYCEQFSVSVVCELNKKKICTVDFKSNVEYGSNIDITFKQPLLFEKYMWYDICVTWPDLDIFLNLRYPAERRISHWSNSQIDFEFEDLTYHGGSFIRALKFNVT